MIALGNDVTESALFRKKNRKKKKIEETKVVFDEKNFFK